MAYLKDLLKQVTYICTRGTMDCKVTHICHDSRQVVRGSMFICLAGSWEDLGMIILLRQFVKVQQFV